MTHSRPTESPDSFIEVSSIAMRKKKGDCADDDRSLRESPMRMPLEGAFQVPTRDKASFIRFIAYARRHGNLKLCNYAHCDCAVRNSHASPLWESGKDFERGRVCQSTSGKAPVLLNQGEFRRRDYLMSDNQHTASPGKALHCLNNRYDLSLMVG